MHLHILVAVVSVVAILTSLGKASAQERPYCETSCGNVNITFPFGSGPGCYHGPEFLVTCDRTHSEGPTLFLRASEISITNLSISTGEIEVTSYVAHDCYDSNGLRDENTSNDPSFTLMYFQVSTKNRFVAIGCDTDAYILGLSGGEYYGTGCMSVCDNNSGVTNGSCSGVGCCEVKIPEGMGAFNLSLGSFFNHTNILKFNPCSHAFVVNQEYNHFNFSSTNLIDFGSIEKMPMLLDWAIGNETCDIASKDTQNFLCKGNSECDQKYAGSGYRCRCLEGYQGNPYIKDNCTNINECLDRNHVCLHKCVDTVGNYTCSCRRGYSGDGRKDGSGCTVKQSLVIMIAMCSLIAFILLLILITWVYVGVKKRKVMMLREKFFKQNGGIMLQQRISNSKDGGSHERFRLFTMKELNKATDNYDESKIIGKGGYGTVYKGILSDNMIVAIKKSKLVDQTQIEQFINEVVILSQINHRNVVKLIGCCLEAEIPLLVYEFIPNGTLSDHIHEESTSVAVTWDIRLRIATETAGALSYLHYAASVPIVHRDIKTNNILLDDSYVAKVADFGASKLIPVDQIELETLVRGTLGYLDPEYLQTSQLTDKSDVYSFGVVLVELITGQKALNFDRPEEERSLAKYFLSSLKNGRLFQVLDQHLQLKELPNEIIQVSRIAERCLRVKGDERPTMKEVATELEGIMASVIQKHPWVQSIENEEEGEHLLQQSANYYAFTDRGSGSSSTFDSMSKQITLPAASGR
uniref:putative wall-associated receptor kinase-like 16 n=1 Tax=Erigeron canadensis TaxID=72917 RepID=UPI001CB92177|nr:putative wall-associated receptor kinase-like 16 [Erigeron canadensis]